MSNRFEDVYKKNDTNEGYGEGNGDEKAGVQRGTSPQRPATKATANARLIAQVSDFVEQYMSRYDTSHDFQHVRRVVGLAHSIYADLKEQENALVMDLTVITLAALLHDVGDRKYVEPMSDANTLVLATLLRLGAPEDLAVQVQQNVLGVSYTAEVRDPGKVRSLLLKYPELAVVQDADRLDAIGAIGIGRTFTFGGVRGVREMGETMAHFSAKLEKLEGMMKTQPGKRLARERTERLETFTSWWQEEQREAESPKYAPEIK